MTDLEHALLLLCLRILARQDAGESISQDDRQALAQVAAELPTLPQMQAELDANLASELATIRAALA